MNGTKLACWTNGVDTAVAHDANDARRVIADLLGERIEDIAPMTRVDDAKVLAVWSESAPDPLGCACREWARADLRKSTPNGHHPNCGEGRPSKTAAEWAQSNGRGFLCSTEVCEPTVTPAVRPAPAVAPPAAVTPPPITNRDVLLHMEASGVDLLSLWHGIAETVRARQREAVAKADTAVKSAAQEVADAEALLSEAKGRLAAAMRAQQDAASALRDVIAQTGGQA